MLTTLPRCCSKGQAVAAETSNIALEDKDVRRGDNGAVGVWGRVIRNLLAPAHGAVEGDQRGGHEGVVGLRVARLDGVPDGEKRVLLNCGQGMGDGNDQRGQNG